MTVKGEPDYPIVQAQSIEPEIDLTEPAVKPTYSAPPAPTPTNPATTTTGTTTTTYTTTHVQPPPSNGFGRESCVTNCPNCHQQTNTRVSHRIDGVTIVAVVILLFFFWPLFWLPLVIPSCQTTEHYCRNCNYRIAREDAC